MRRGVDETPLLVSARWSNSLPNLREDVFDFTRQNLILCCKFSFPLKLVFRSRLSKIAFLNNKLSHYTRGRNKTTLNSVHLLRREKKILNNIPIVRKRNSEDAYHIV